MPEQRFPQLWTSVYFWFIVLGVAFFKAVSSQTPTRAARIAAFGFAVFAAAAFSEPVIEYFKIEGDYIKYGVVGLVALTGEHLMALTIACVRDPGLAIRLWRQFRGGSNAK